MKIHLSHLTLALAFLLSAAHSTFAHQHLAAGIIDLNGNGQANPGEPLQLLSAPGSDAVFHLLPESTGNLYAGYYALDNQPRPQFPNDYFTFTVLSDGQTSAAAASHPATGSWIWVEISSVSGPAGAHFGFWDEDWVLSHSTPTATFLTNSATGGFKFQLSEGADAAGEDPFGHIHGRGWTVDQPGEYTVAFTLYDLGHQGPGGGAIHPASMAYEFRFLAVPEPTGARLLLLGAAFGFARRRTRK